MATSVRSDGTLLLNGQPFFPFGFFHQSDYGRTYAGMMDDLRQIGLAKFNTLHVVIWEGLSLDEWKRFYDSAQGYGVSILGQVSASAPSGFVAIMKDHPATLGWYIADDVQTGSNFAAIAATNQQYKTMDPNHVTNYAALMSRLVNVDPGRLADTFGAESYPVGNGDNPDVVTTAVLAAVTAAAKYQQSPWVYLQTFAWPGKAAPTFAQYQTMATAAIAAGAKGILNYTFFDGANYLPDYAELWAGIQTMPKIISGLVAANKAPTFVVKPSAMVASYTIALSALGADDAGEPKLTYSWGTVGTQPSSAIYFSNNKNNTAKNTTATVGQRGTYTFRCTIADAGGLRSSSDVVVTVG